MPLPISLLAIHPNLVKDGYAGGDGYHPCPLGGEALAQSVPLDWFAETTEPVGERRLIILMGQESIDAYLGRQIGAMREALASLVEIPSFRTQAENGAPYGKGPDAALHRGAQLAAALGLRTRTVEDVMVEADLGEGDEPRLGILCHLDVVPEGTGWTVPPYSLTRRDGRLYGRGTIDDKGPAVASLFALGALHALQIPLAAPVRLLLGSDEENGSSDLALYRSKRKMPPMLFTPDGDYPIINIEKGMLRASFGAAYRQAGDRRILWLRAGKAANAVPGQAEACLSGISQQEVEEAARAFSSAISFSCREQSGELHLLANGRGAHASTPEQGENALTGLIQLLCALPGLEQDGLQRLLQALGQLFPHGETDGKSAGLSCREPESGALTLALSVLQCCEDTLEGTVDIRFPLCETLSGVTQKLSQALTDQGFSFKNTMGSEPHMVPKDSPFVQTLLEVYSQQTGLPGYCIAIGGGTYVHGIPGGVAFGAMFPGEENHMHGADEFITEENLLRNAKMIAHAVLALCGK